MRRVAVLMVAVLGLAGCGAKTEAAPESTTTTTAAPADIRFDLTFTAVPGNYSGVSRQNDTEGGPCGIPPISQDNATLIDFLPGTPATIKDGSGVVLDTTEVGGGNVVNLNVAARTFDCVFHVEATVPPSAFYSVEINGKTWATIDASTIVAGVATGTLTAP